MSDAVRVSYTDGQAEARIGERTLAVAQRDNEARTSVCPLELVSAALGS
jgi:hypothetical protein